MGILLLHPEESDIDANLDVNLDIIAIHGLNGNREKTWTEPKSQKLWLRDFLPKDIPRARIMVFGYNAKPVLASSTAGVVEHARDLLTCLMEMREEREGIKRPLIFIGHSLGGLVIKQTLVIAKHEHRYKHIYHSTKGVIFFGTPHQGSSLADYGSLLARVPTLLANKPNPELLETLKKGSHALMHLTENFKGHHEHNESPYAIVSFYETRALKGTKTLVVEKVSALLTPPSDTPTYEEQIPVDATHRDMCRFSCDKDKTYRRAVGCIKRIHLGQSTMDVELGNEYYVVPHTVNSNFTGRNDIRRRLKETLIGDEYEVQRAQKRFVLYGLGGSGKTELCLKLAQDYKQSFWGIFWVDASTNEMAEEGFLKIARACKQDANLESVKAWLASKEHWLLIIDNADDPTVDVSRLIPSGTKGAVLITTRNPDFQKFASAGSYRVDEMSPEDATSLLLKTTALQNIEEKEKEIAGDVVKTLGFLALAIIQAGAVIRQRLIGLDGFCELYSKRKKELLESGRSNSNIDYQRSVYTTWEISVKMIEDIREQHAVFALELLRLFSFMHYDGIFEGIFELARKDHITSVENSGFSKTLLVRMMPLEWDQLLMGKALSLLVAFSLVTVDESRRISMHPLVHEWSRARMPDEERAKAWKISVIALSRATTFRSWLADLQQRRALLPHIDAILSHQEQDIFSDGYDLEDRIFATWKFGMAYRENCRIDARGLSLKALRCVEDKFPINYMSRQYAAGEVAHDLEASGNYKDAIEIRERLLKEEREKADKNSYSITKAAILLAEDYTFHGSHQKAIELCEDTINEYENILDEGSSILLDLWQMLGEATFASGDPKTARKFLERALECYNKREYPDKDFHGIEVSRRLAIVYEILGCAKKAKDAQDRYIAQLKDAYGVDHIRTVIAIARCKELDMPRAFSVRSYVRSRARGIALTKEAFENHRSVQGESHVATLSCMAQLAWDYYRCGALAKAIALQEELVKLLIQKWGEDHDNTTDAIRCIAKMRRNVAIRKVFYWWLPKGLLEKDWVRN